MWCVVCGVWSAWSEKINKWLLDDDIVLYRMIATRALIRANKTIIEWDWTVVKLEVVSIVAFAEFK